MIINEKQYKEAMRKVEMLGFSLSSPKKKDIPDVIEKAGRAQVSELYESIKKEFEFSVDLCANSANTKCALFCSDFLHTDAQYLSFVYGGIMRNGYLFMNPPYSDPGLFIRHAWELSAHYPVVVLVPNTLKTCKYMDVLDENNGETTFRKWKQGVEIRDLSRRTKFSHPRKESSSPNFGCMVIILDRRDV